MLFFYPTYTINIQNLLSDFINFHLKSATFLLYLTDTIGLVDNNFKKCSKYVLVFEQKK